MAKSKKLNLKALKNGVNYNLGDGISISKDGDNISVNFPNYNNPNISLVSVKRSAEGKSTFGSVAVNAKGFGTLNVQVFRNANTVQRQDETGNIVSMKEVAYSFRQNNQPISRSNQPALAQVIANEKDNIIKMLEFETDQDFEAWACEHLVNKENGEYKDDKGITYLLQDYKQSSRAYESILRQKNAGRALSEAQQKVLDTVEEKANAGISRLVVRYGKRTLASYDFDAKLGAITSDNETTETTETVDLSGEEDEI